MGWLSEKFKRGDIYTDIHRHVPEQSRVILRNLHKSKLRVMRNLTCFTPFLVLQPNLGIAPVIISIQTNGTAPPNVNSLKGL
jgi:hypothetical protein